MLTQIPKAYPYGEYSDDLDIVAVFNSFNTEAQAIFLWLVSTCLGDYRQDPVSGPLLDWVAKAIYGMDRHILPSSATYSVIGELANNILAYDELAGGLISEQSSTAETLSDDLFRRSITWNSYLGDGLVFSTPWLRKRLIRYLYSKDGYDIDVHTYWDRVSIQWIGNRTANVKLSLDVSSVSSTLIHGLATGYLKLPLGYQLNLIWSMPDPQLNDWHNDIL